MSVQRVLAVDPGTKFCGWAIIEAEQGVGANRFHALGLGTIVLPNLHIMRRFGVLGREIRKVAAQARASGVRRGAVERPFMNNRGAATLAIAGARAVVCDAMENEGLQMEEYPPNVWKQIVGSGAADIHRVANVVKTLLGLSQDPPLDAAAAAGIGMYDLSVRD